MDVLHIDMPMLDPWGQACFPLASAILGSISKSRGFSYSYLEGSKNYASAAKTINNGVPIDNYIDDIVSKIITAEPEIVTFSINQWNQGICYQILEKLLSNKSWKSNIILGGPQVTLVHEQIYFLLNRRLKHVLSDNLFLGLGEAEIVYNNFLNVCNSTNLSNNSLAGLGIVNVSREFCSSVGKKIVQDLSEKYYLPDYEAFDLDYYFAGGNRKMAVVEVGRGCINNCTFCASRNIWGTGNRRRPVENVISEIEFLKRRVCLEHIFLAQDNFLNDKNSIISLIYELKKVASDVKWGAYATFSSIDADMLGCFSKANCDHLFFGIESGDPVERKKCCGNKVAHNFEEILELCLKKNITPIVSYIVRSCRTSEFDKTVRSVLALTSTGIQNIKVVPLQLIYNSIEFFENHEKLRKIKTPMLWGEDLVVQKGILNNYLKLPISKYLWPQIYSCLGSDADVKELYIKKNLLLVIQSWFVNTIQVLKIIGFDLLTFFDIVYKAISNVPAIQNVLKQDASINDLKVIQRVVAVIKNHIAMGRESLLDALHNDEILALISLNRYDLIFHSSGERFLFWTRSEKEEIVCFSIEDQIGKVIESCFLEERWSDCMIPDLINCLANRGLTNCELYAYLLARSRGGGANETGEKGSKVGYYFKDTPILNLSGSGLQ